MNLLLNVLATISLTEIQFTIDVLKQKYIYNGVMFHCYQNNFATKIQKMFNQQNIRFSTTSSSKAFFPYHRTRSAVVVDTACEEWTTVLESSTISFQNYSFIIITNNLSLTSNVLSKYPIQVDSDFILVHKTNSSIDLYEVYNTGFQSNGIFNVINVGYWYSSKSFFIKKFDRMNLQGLRIKVAVIILPSPKLFEETVEHYMEKARTKVDTVHKIKFFILLKYMREMFNISYDLHRVNSWGYQRNGTFDGMVGALSRGMADIGGAPCFFRSDRARNVQYISEVWMSRHSFIFRHPKHPGGFYTIYSRPLSNIVWCCMIALLMLTVIITWIMLRMQDNKPKEQDSSFSLASLFTLGAICQQDMYISQSTMSLKLTTFVTFVYAVILYQYYNATIVSSLLMEPPKNIKTLKDLLDSDLKVGADDIIYNKDYFKRTTDPVAIDLYKRKIHTTSLYNFFKAEDGMALVQKGGFAFHVDTAVAFPVIKDSFKERELCDIQLVQMYPLQKCGVVIRRNSPYKEHISYGIRKMYEAGLLHRIRAAIDVPMPVCAHTPDVSVYCVSIREFSTPLLILLLGNLCSLVIFTGEILISKIRDRKFIVFLA